MSTRMDLLRLALPSLARVCAPAPTGACVGRVVMTIRGLLRLSPLALVCACPPPGEITEMTAQTSGPETSTSTSTTGEPTTGGGATGSTAGTTTEATTTATSTTSTGTTSTGTDSSSSSGGPEMTTGEPAPEFTPLALEVADFNGDGLADLLELGVDDVNAVAGGISLGMGDGTFAPAIDPMLVGTSAFPTIGILDDAKGVEVVMADSGAEAMAFRWKTSDFQLWKILASAGIPLMHVVTDTDLDGLDDVVVLWREGTFFGLVHHWNQGSDLWPRKISSLGHTDQFLIAPTALLVGPLDGDGRADGLLFEADAPGGFLRVLGKADGGFVAPTPVATQLRPWTAALGDFDEDGALDVLVVEHTPARLLLLLGNGGGGFTPATTVDVTGFVPLALTLVDLDGDGHLDVLAVDDLTPELRLWPGMGDGTFDAEQVIPLPSGAVRVHAALLNDDAQLDLAVATFQAGAVTILLEL